MSIEITNEDKAIHSIICKREDCDDAKRTFNVRVNNSESQSFKLRLARRVFHRVNGSATIPEEQEWQCTWNAGEGNYFEGDPGVTIPANSDENYSVIVPRDRVKETESGIYRIEIWNQNLTKPVKSDGTEIDNLDSDYSSNQDFPDDGRECTKTGRLFLLDTRTIGDHSTNGSNIDLHYRSGSPPSFRLSVGSFPIPPLREPYRDLVMELLEVFKSKKFGPHPDADNLKIRYDEERSTFVTSKIPTVSSGTLGNNCQWDGSKLAVLGYQILICHRREHKAAGRHLSGQSEHGVCLRLILRRKGAGNNETEEKTIQFSKESEIKACFEHLKKLSRGTGDLYDPNNMSFHARCSL